MLQYEGAKDPDEFIKKFGVERFRLVVKNAADSTAYQLQSAAGKHDLSTDAGRVDYLNESVRLLAGLQSPIERDVFISRLSKELEAVSYTHLDVYKRQAIPAPPPASPAAEMVWCGLRKGRTACTPPFNSPATEYSLSLTHI